MAEFVVEKCWVGFYIYSWQFRATGRSTLEFSGWAECSYLCKSQSLEREAVRCMWFCRTLQEKSLLGLGSWLFFFFCLFVWVFLCFQALDLSSVYKMFPLFNVLRLLGFFYYYYNFQTAVSPNSSAFSAQPSLLLPATPARAFVQNKGLLLKTAWYFATFVKTCHNNI